MPLQRPDTCGIRSLEKKDSSGLYNKLVELADLQGMLAPTPLLMDLGLYDSCFMSDTSLPVLRRVEEIYKAAGAADKFHADIFPGEHAWGANKSVEFFSKYLR